MASSVKNLAKDTVIYGSSSIIGRFLNWLLVPLYTQQFIQSQYGVVNYVYAIVALVLVGLTYGMETGFFRFANHERYTDPMEVYSTTLTSIGVSSTTFLAIVILLLAPITHLMQCGDHTSYVAFMAIAVACDAFTAIPFSYLRYRHRALRFATLKFVGIGLNITLNLWWILVCPLLYSYGHNWVTYIWSHDFGIGYVFLSNMISSIVTLLLLIPELTGFRWCFNRKLWQEMMAYSLPLLVLGFAGIMNQNLDKIIFPYLVNDHATAMSQLGIYSACYKIAIVMVMFLQAFRFAYEPFIFDQSRSRGEDRLQAYRIAMKWFVVFAMLIFMGVCFYMPLIRHFIAPSYWNGLDVVPVIMMAEFFFGVFFNLSLWYKLTDRTIWGVWFTLLGLVITISLNILLVPLMGYRGCAWAAFSCYGVMMVASWAVGRKKYPIGYNVPRLLAYVAVAVLLYLIGITISTGHNILDMALRTVLMGAYLTCVLRLEHMTLSALLPINKILAKFHR